MKVVYTEQALQSLEEALDFLIEGYYKIIYRLEESTIYINELILS